MLRKWAVWVLQWPYLASGNLGGVGSGTEGGPDVTAGPHMKLQEEKSDCEKARRVSGGTQADVPAPLLQILNDLCAAGPERIVLCLVQQRLSSQIPSHYLSPVPARNSHEPIATEREVQKPTARGPRAQV